MALPPLKPESEHARTQKPQISSEDHVSKEAGQAPNRGEPEGKASHFDPETQPEEDSGVTEDGSEGEDSIAEDGAQDVSEDEDMATLAVNPGLISGTFEAETTRSAGSFAGMEDAEIMLKLKAGDMAAFDYLLARYRRPIIHFMYRMVHNEAVAEELAQEVFLRVYRSRETYRAEAKFSTWVYRIATNLGVNHARDTRHERAASTIYLDEPDSESGSTPDVPDMTPSAEANILRRERMAAIREHVMDLPERQQMAVLMHKYEGMDYKQIGEVLKLSESATKSLLFRAYQTLREKLKPFI